MRRDEELDAQLRALPEAHLSAALAARVHGAARAMFERGDGRAAGIATAAAVVSAVAIYHRVGRRALSALARG